MPYVKTFDRDQFMMCSWDSLVDPESIARLIDAFVASLDARDLCKWLLRDETARKQIVRECNRFVSEHFTLDLFLEQLEELSSVKLGRQN